MDIKIFMCCHKNYSTVPPLCIPVQAGAALNPPIDGTIKDNEGENISAKNREYCELTVHYYAWKNVEADYYGFCHYRRFFCFDSQVEQAYVAVKSINKRNRKLLDSAEKISNIISEYDAIVPRPEDVGATVRKYYGVSSYQHHEDLEKFLSILYELYPHMKEAAEEYLLQNKQYFCNMFIMKKELFYEYCEIMFSVLDEFDKIKVMYGDFRSDRTDGYLGERFTGIFFTYLSRKGAKIKEIARVDNECTLKKRIINAVLPPESKRRLIFKKISDSKNY